MLFPTIIYLKMFILLYHLLLQLYVFQSIIRLTVNPFHPNYIFQINSSSVYLLLLLLRSQDSTGPEHKYKQSYCLCKVWNEIKK